MTKYQAVILTSRGSEQELQDKINIALDEFSSKGWKLHSQNCWYGECGQTNFRIIKRGNEGEWFKCTLIFEKEINLLRKL